MDILDDMGVIKGLVHFWKNFCW